jgi:hypothetical protein
VNPVAHLIALCAAALRGGLTFVADAPGKDAGMILVLLDHFPEHLLASAITLGFLICSSVNCHRDFWNQENSMPVGGVENMFTR